MKTFIYTIIGVFRKDSATPQEIAVSLCDRDNSKSVSDDLHHAVGSLLGFGRFLSLKELGGFGLYKVEELSNFSE